MEEIKKIIAKAAFGQGTESFRKEVHINTEERKKPAEILGTIITNAAISSCTLEGNVSNGKAVRIKGTFDVHLWYTQNGDSKAVKTGAKFSNVVMVYGQEAEKYSNEEVRAWIQKAPECLGTTIVDSPEGSGVKAAVEYELGAEVVGLTTLNVKVINHVDFLQSFEEIPGETGEIPDEYEDD